ncbi:PEST proteolytic signal-containing nuclear protein-like isoform X2 [Coccinella septempunctata]|uniref:PEST proteolytic signal-containing nuclear protein-like isoform X2 n=1 Tax=Coccinella septempunctata TaxID=41139 RepID=UPI001D066C42|nr:PEST proteolytic signal-containing nuclear protein-like isoform X2 [Coccinella septempunctata]
MDEKPDIRRNRHEDSRRRSRSRSPHDRPKDSKEGILKEEKKMDNIGLGAKNRLKSLGIQMKLGANKAKEMNKPKLSVAAVFNADEDSEPEEMPPEAKMRMRNIGRDTPTSSGPNSFGKTKHGFSDTKKVFEKDLKKSMDSLK